MLRVKLVILSLIFFSSCAGYWNIGSDSYNCPHIRPSFQTTCMPASVIETLDERGKFDWRWHPVCRKNDKNCSAKKLAKILQGEKKQTEAKPLYLKGVNQSILLGGEDEKN